MIEYMIARSSIQFAIGLVTGKISGKAIASSHHLSFIIVDFFVARFVPDLNPYTPQ